MMQQPSYDDNDAPIAELDHDHDDLTVVLQDLHVLVQQATVDESRARALPEARRLLHYFREDLQSHFEHEEQVLFPTLREHLPERHQTIEALGRAHTSFVRIVGEISERLGSDNVDPNTLRGCLTQIDYLVEFFKGHSSIECDLLRHLDARVREPETRAQLRARLQSHHD